MALISFTTDGVGTGGDGDLNTVTFNGQSLVNIYGGFGGGTVSLKFIDQTQTPQPQRDGATAITITAENGDVYNFGYGVRMQFDLQGSTTPALFIAVNSLNKT